MQRLTPFLWFDYYWEKLTADGGREVEIKAGGEAV